MDIAKLKSINAKILLVKSNIEHKKNEILMTEAQIKNLNDRLLLQNETLKKLVMKEIIKDEPRVPVDNWDLNYHLKSLTSVVEALPFGAPQFLIQNGSPIEDNSCNIFLNSDIEFGNLLQEDFRQWMGSISLPQTTPRDLIAEECHGRLTLELQNSMIAKETEDNISLTGTRLIPSIQTMTPGKLRQIKRVQRRTKDKERKRQKRLSETEEELKNRRLKSAERRKMKRQEAIENGTIYAIRAKEAEATRQRRALETEEQAQRRRMAEAERMRIMRRKAVEDGKLEEMRAIARERQRQYRLVEKEEQSQQRKLADANRKRMRKQKAIEDGTIDAMRAKTAEYKRQARSQETEEESRKRRMSDAERRSRKRLAGSMTGSVDSLSLTGGKRARSEGFNGPGSGEFNLSLLEDTIKQEPIEEIVRGIPRGYCSLDTAQECREANVTDRMRPAIGADALPVQGGSSVVDEEEQFSGSRLTNLQRKAMQRRKTKENETVYVTRKKCTALQGQHQLSEANENIVADVRRRRTPKCARKTIINTSPDIAEKFTNVKISAPHRETCSNVGKGTHSNRRCSAPEIKSEATMAANEDCYPRRRSAKGQLVTISSSDRSIDDIELIIDYTGCQ